MSNMYSILYRFSFADMIFIYSISFMNKISKVNSFINDQKEFLEYLFIKDGKYMDISEWSPKDEEEDFVWIAGTWLRRYLEQSLSVPAPTMQTLPSFAPPSNGATILCEHQGGLYPLNALKGKWIKRSIFDAIEQFHVEKKRSLKREIEEAPNFEPVALRSNFQCGICVEAYSKRLQDKLCLIRKIIEVNELLDVPVSIDLEVENEVRRHMKSFFSVYLVSG